MPNFLFKFTDTTVQAVSTVIVADTQEEAEAMFNAGEWEARINGEEVTDRSPRHITEVGPFTAKEHNWRNPLAVPQEAKRG